MLCNIEGGYYQVNGVFRPEQNSVMKNVSTLSFNAPSREDITRKIHKIMGLPFDFQEFLENDEPSIYPVFSPVTNSFRFPSKDFIKTQEMEKLMSKRK